MKLAATMANSLWLASNLPAWWAFRRALHRPKETQQKLLSSIIARSAKTAFGQAHNFHSIRSLKDFQSAVPIRDYADVEPWIARIRRGEANVVTPDPVKRLATTSGTTSARKLIPYTRSLQADFNRAIAPWIVDLFLSAPSLMLGPAYWSISPLTKHESEESAVPIGFEEDSEYLGGLTRHVINAAMAVPASVRLAANMDEWRSLTLGYLSRQRDLRLISIWHPSFLSLLLGDSQPDPGKLWPHLYVISCWADGHSAGAVEELRRRFPRARIQPKGLIATEAIISIPFANQWPLAIRSHFFEFLAGDGSLYTAENLVQGEAYETIVTTNGGLYRYRLNDLIRVEGFVGKTPSIRFLGKTSFISDRFGEKLSQPFVTSVLAALQSQNNVTWPFAMLAPEGNAYTLYVEGSVWQRLASDLDLALCQNTHYAYCRDLGQLRSPHVCQVGANASARYLDRLCALGQRLGDIKPTSLSTLDGWQDFMGESIPRRLPQSGPNSQPEES